ncbi:MAG: ATP-binding protein [Campylobacterales bacterium]|nr:ATP-binding protein [Campylobacterales bacterium]
MKFLIDFIESKDVTKTEIYQHLKCSQEEANILKHMTKEYLEGVEDLVVSEILSNLYKNQKYGHIQHVHLIKDLLDLGWIVQNSFHQLKINDISGLELLNSSISLSSTFLKLLENGSLDLVLPEITPYTDHLEYLQDQFLRIELYQKLNNVKQNYAQNSPNISRLKNKLTMLENRIEERLKVTTSEIIVDKFFKDYHLDEKEQIIFLALLKEEYASGGDDNLREMNALIDLISFDDYERIKNRSMLEESSKLIEQGLIDYDEMLSPFGGISRSFFIPEDTLQKIIYPQKKKKAKKMKLDMLVKEQELFELVEPKTSLIDVVLNPKTREVLDTLLKQIDKKVVNLLIEWGVKDKKSGLSSKIIFYGPPGTGKTMTAESLAKSLKKQVLSIDCSKILSMYVGESEKNVKKIFDTYKELSQKSKSEPILLLDEADQFLSFRTTSSQSSADKMHNQMQNIFLEQIEKFDGILIATTNLLENIDPAFSRRFNYKIEFKKPNLEQRLELWKKMLPKNAPFEKGFSIEKLANFNLTGGQINLIVKNCAYKVAGKEEPLFKIDDFVTEIQKELTGTFDGEKALGFLV